MDQRVKEPLWNLLGLLHKSHPWHGIDVGERFPEVLTAFIEIVPTDTVKYEIDKITGHLMIDRPQSFSNVLPCLYGFVPRTLCADAVAQLAAQATGRADIEGDEDPIDICIMTEKTIVRGDIIVRAIPVGGFRLLDGDEVDDGIGNRIWVPLGQRNRARAQQPHGRRQHHPRREHRHAEQSGERRRGATRRSADLLQEGGAPDTDGELGQHGVDDEQPRHEHLAPSEDRERERL